MKCQIIFSRKNKINISKCHLLKFLPSMPSIKKSMNFIQWCLKALKINCQLLSDLWHKMWKFLLALKLVHVVCLFVLRFYGPVTPVGSCQA